MNCPLAEHCAQTLDALPLLLALCLLLRLVGPGGYGHDTDKGEKP
jgi:hypothetical protein